jgi:hypothetical protein
MANMKIDEIEGIGAAYAGKLAADGIGDTDTLLEKGCTRKGRAAIAEKCDISEKLVLKWVNMAACFVSRASAASTPNCSNAVEWTP